MSGALDLVEAGEFARTAREHFGHGGDRETLAFRVERDS